MKNLIMIMSLAVFACSATALAGNGGKNKAVLQQKKVGLNIGDIAPDLKFKNPDGKEVSLSSLRGNIVLIDFWASWCRPCRMENPNVVKAYNEFRKAKFNGAKGFRIYGVSLDKSHNPWVGAIKRDGLSWTNVSDLGGWYSKPAVTYHVNSIPANFLLDANGVIIAKNLHGPSLQTALQKLVKN